MLFRGSSPMSRSSSATNPSAWQSAGEANVPIVVYLRNVEFHELAGDLSELKSAHYIANSDFTARAYRDRFGIQSTVIPPTIDPERYRTPTSKEYVTFINPYKEKGFELAVRIAERCPEIPFLFVESWKLDGDHRAAVEQTIAPLKNVTLQSRTDDMKTVYGRTKILLAPSKWEEAWGRVASEAHCSGIPVVGSRRGGLPEAIGEGGIVLDYDAPLDDWVASIRQLWNDADHYDRLSAAALDLFEAAPARSRASVHDVPRRPATRRRQDQDCGRRLALGECPAIPAHRAPRSIGMQHEDRLCRW